MFNTPCCNPLISRRRFLRVVVAVVTASAISSMSMAHGGLLGDALGRVLRKRVIGREKASLMSRTVVAKRTLTQAEKQALQRELLELDRRTLARIETKYGQYIDPARLSAAKNCKSCFLDKRQYDEHLKRAYPELSAKERTGIVGDYLKRPYVNHNRTDVPSTLAHERLHQLSSNGRGAPFGGRFGEGITEHFANRIYGNLGIRGIPPAYPAERRVIQMIEARVGEGPIAQAYFRGDTRSMQQALDRQLGPGAFDTVIRYTERGRTDLAERVLRHGL